MTDFGKTSHFVDMELRVVPNTTDHTLSFSERFMSLGAIVIFLKILQSCRSEKATIEKTLVKVWDGRKHTSTLKLWSGWY